MAYLLSRTKEYNKLDKAQKSKAVVPGATKRRKLRGQTDECEEEISQLRRACEGLHEENYKLSQEIQYLELKLKVLQRH